MKVKPINLIWILGIVAMVTGYIELKDSRVKQAAPVLFFQDEIDNAQLEYIIEILEEDSLMMDSAGNIVPIELQ